MVVAAFVMSLGLGVTMSLAEADKGPADITINADSKSEKPKPAQFPHAAHQEKFSCAECHHYQSKFSLAVSTFETCGLFSIVRILQIFEN